MPGLARLVAALAAFIALPCVHLAAFERVQAGHSLAVVERGLGNYAAGHATLLIALEETLEPIQIVILRGAAEELKHWQRELDEIYAPRRLVFGIPASEVDLPPSLADKKPGTEILGYVCRGEVCSAALHSLPALIAIARE